MSKLLISFIFFIALGNTFGQNETSIYTWKAGNHFEVPDSSLAMFSSGSASYEYQEEARNITPPFFQKSSGKMISFKTSGGKDASGYLIKAPEESKRYLIVLHDVWGLNAFVKQKSEKLYKDLKDVNVLAVDLYDGKVAETRKKGEALMEEVKKERTKQILEGAIAFSGKNARIGIIGWGMGGSRSLQAAILAGSHLVACVMFYGTPEDDVEKLKHIKAPVLAIFAEKDEEIPSQVIQDFEQDMEDADEELTVKIFDAGQAFDNPSTKNFDKDAAEKAHRVAVKFLEEGYENVVD